MAKAKYTKNSRGEYATKVWDGTYNPDGTKHRVNLKSNKSSADLERKVNALKQKVESGNYVVPTDKLFGEYADEWLTVRKSSRGINTRTMYKNIIDKHLAFLSTVRLCDIRNSHFQTAINNALDKPRTCQQIYITFKQIIRMAVTDSYITEEMAKNITTDISLPKYEKTEKRPLSEVEKATLKDCLSSNILTPREKAYLLIIFSTGLRRCEALALTAFDFSFSASGNSVSITKDLIFEGNNPEIRMMTKTSNGLRSVPLPADVAAWLKEYIAGLSGTNLFSCKTSSLITKSSYDKMWASIIRKMNTAAGGSSVFPVIDDLTAHIFRHNYCTNLCYQVPAISIKKIAQLLGDTERVVIDVYNHIIEEKEDVSGVINDLFAI